MHNSRMYRHKSSMERNVYLIETSHTFRLGSGSTTQITENPRMQNAPKSRCTMRRGTDFTTWLNTLSRSIRRISTPRVAFMALHSTPQQHTAMSRSHHCY